MRMFVLAIAMMMGLGATAQHRGEKRGEPLNPEQRAEMQTKKMTLALELNDKQQADVKKLLTEKGKERQKEMEKHKADKEAGKKPTKEERAAFAMKRLDNQLAMQSEMKKILTPAQFEKFKKMREERERKITNKRKNFKKDNER